MFGMNHGSGVPIYQMAMMDGKRLTLHRKRKVMVKISVWRCVPLISRVGPNPTAGLIKT